MLFRLAPAIGPKRAAMKARNGYAVEIFVFGIGVGIETKRFRTRKMAEPMLIATMVRVFYFILVLFLFGFLLPELYLELSEKT